MRRRAGVVGVVAVAVMAAAASVAWACTAISAVYSINPSAAPAGTTVVVTGANFYPRAVEIRWNSVDGPVIGTTRGPDFAAQATIPTDATPGHHRVFATQEGSLNPEISFQVTAADSPAPAEHQSDPGPGRAGSDVADDSASQPSSNPGVELSSPPASAQGPSSSSSPATGSSSSSGSGRGGAGASRPPTPPPSSGGGATPPSPSSPGQASPAATASAPGGPDEATPALTPTRRSASGEVSFASPWPSDTASGQSLSRPAPQRPGGLGAGMGFLALGLAGLMGATIVGLRRRAWSPGARHHHHDQGLL